MAIANLISLGGTELTDQGRIFTETMDKREVDVELANGTIKKYVKARKKVFNMEWDWIPSESSGTFDLKGARDAIRAAAIQGTTKTLVVKNSLTGSETFTVFVESYSEELLRRDFSGNKIFWNVKVELREQ